MSTSHDLVLKKASTRAEEWDVSLKTVDRWEKAQRVGPYIRINGRKYLPGDQQPKTDRAA